MSRVLENYKSNLNVIIEHINYIPSPVQSSLDYFFQIETKTSMCILIFSLYQFSLSIFHLNLINLHTASMRKKAWLLNKCKYLCK